MDVIVLHHLVIEMHITAHCHYIVPPENCELVQHNFDVSHDCTIFAQLGLLLVFLRRLACKLQLQCMIFLCNNCCV